MTRAQLAQTLRFGLWHQNLFRNTLPVVSRTSFSADVRGYESRAVVYRRDLHGMAMTRKLTPDFVRYQTNATSNETPRQTETTDLLSQLEQRGLVESCTGLDALRSLLQEQSIKLYCGFDPTADCLHLGNLLAVIVLVWFHNYGHKPVALVGGATGRVGDPSGKQTERPLLSDAQLQNNTDSIAKSLRVIFARNADNASLEVVNNLDWFGEMTLLEFLRDVGKNARVGTMLGKESVRTRIASENGISFTEFSYQLLQGYDFYRLCRNNDLVLQIGGSDQWGNITAGIDLTRRLWPQGEGLPEIYALTFPLLVFFSNRRWWRSVYVQVDSEGKKFGKSESGAIWLSADKLSPYRFYQYLFSTSDIDVVRFLKMLTFLPLAEIDTLQKSMTTSDYVPNSAQRKLAEEVTKFVHGDEGLKAALAATEALRPGAETKLNAETLSEVAGEAPTATLPRSEIVNAFVTDVLVKVKLQESKSAGRKMIRNGGVRVNNNKLDDERSKLTEADLIDGRLLLLAAGKKNKLLVKVE